MCIPMIVITSGNPCQGFRASLLSWCVHFHSPSRRPGVLPTDQRVRFFSYFCVAEPAPSFTPHWSSVANLANNTHPGGQEHSRLTSGRVKFRPIRSAVAEGIHNRDYRSCHMMHTLPQLPFCLNIPYMALMPPKTHGNREKLAGNGQVRRRLLSRPLSLTSVRILTRKGLK